jgi:hypothetical protein
VISLQSYRRPAWRLTLGEEDLSGKIDGRLSSLTLTDNRGFEADQLDVVLSDHDGRLDIPPRGAELTLSIGWDGEGLVEKGTFRVDEVEHSGAPDQITLRARSADLRSGIAAQHERSWHDTTLGAIVHQVADECGLRCLADVALASLDVEHVDQTNESSANLLTRLAQDYGAIATVKAGVLLFTRSGIATTAGGHAIPAATLTRADGDQHRFSVADRDTYIGVRAQYHDLSTGLRGEVLITQDNIDEDGQMVTREQILDKRVDHSADNVKTLRHTYATQSTASRAARAEYRRLQRGIATFHLTLAHGRPDLYPETPCTVSGWKPAIDGTDWLIARVTHHLTDSGYTTAVEMEIRATEIA